MEIRLPLHVARALSVDEVADVEALIESVRLLDHDVGPLLSSTAVTHFTDLVQKPLITTTVEVSETIGEVAEWRFRVVELDGSECARVVEIPFLVARTTTAPPSAAESLLVQAWFASDKLTDSEGRLRSNIVVFEWLPATPEAAKAVIRAISGVKSQGRSSSVARAWTTATLIALQGASRLLHHKDTELLCRLFVESATELVPRWRFLSLYRILEHGYLENVFTDLSARFFSEPKEAARFSNKCA